jgi:hypothetical protein
MPLLPLLGEDAPFVVLALSPRRARVFRGCRMDLRECEDVPIPRQGVAEIDAEAAIANGQQTSPAARNDVPGAGDIAGKHVSTPAPEELRRAQLAEYLRRVAVGFNRWLAGCKAPVVLVAQPEIRSGFKMTGPFAGRAVLELDMNPDTLDEGELHRRAYELVRPQIEKECAAQLDHFRSLFNDGSAKSTDKVEGIVKAARFGHVDVLLARRGARLWGRYDQEKDRVLVHGEPAEEDEDLLDLAAKDVLRHGGRVFLVGENALRQGQSAGAILRFSQPQ